MGLDHWNNFLACLNFLFFNRSSTDLKKEINLQQKSSLSPSLNPCLLFCNHSWRLFQKTIEVFDCRINGWAFGGAVLLSPVQLQLQLRLVWKASTILPIREWPVVSDFVARFCMLCKSKSFACCASQNHACMILASQCFFLLVQHAKKCDTNHIPEATAYCQLCQSPKLC